MRITHVLGSALLAISFALPLTASATAVEYNFNIPLSAGPLAGGSYGGSFTLDDAMGAGAHNGLSLLDSLDFNFAGHHWTTANANTGSVTLDANGNLSSVLFGSHCSPSCSTFPGLDSWTLFWTGEQNYALFNYSLAGYNSTFLTIAADGSPLVERVVADVPEPSSLALLAGAAIAAAASLRRARRS
ncbi:PEP-CTERM sorting domain-containing protein [Niveibacterium sp. SC-1]|uniref:PEP-CTERM sorting domain-containing protein n=1 Tax=Niveibacterium sp. SC-1 TaxID=3135646 RepID=UPI00311FEB4A